MLGFDATLHEWRVLFLVGGFVQSIAVHAYASYPVARRAYDDKTRLLVRGVPIDRSQVFVTTATV